MATSGLLMRLMARSFFRIDKSTPTITTGSLRPVMRPAGDLCNGNRVLYLPVLNFATTSHLYKKDWCEVTYERADGVTFTVEGKEGDNLLDIAINNDIDLEGFGACEGTLACSTCHLIFKQEDFDKIEDPCTDEELDMLDLAYGLSDTEMCVSLSGCGFLGVYLIGALHGLSHHCPHLVRTAHFSGSSAGAVMAAAVVCGTPLNTVRAGFLRTAAHARKQTMGAFTPGFRIDEQLRVGLESLPEDAHVRASGRLHVSVTRLRDGAHVVFSHWKTREELIRTVRCSCFIVGFSGGWPPAIDGEVYIDGGYRNRQPKISENTITISPYSGEADISPVKVKGGSQVTWANLTIDVSQSNMLRLYRSLMPPPPYILNHYYHAGYKDTLKFLKRQRDRRRRC